MKKIKDNIFYVGAINPNLRVFDIVMATEFGTTYNAYLIKGEKIALIETVHDTFSDEYFDSIREIVPLENIDYIIFNHTEPDHSGSLVKLLEFNSKIKVVGTQSAIKNLKNITNADFDSIAVKTGDTLDLGGDNILEFTTSPNLHWPDTMFTYLKSQKTVFTCDFLGAHYCEPNIFDSKITYPKQYLPAFKYYYDCIMSPFKKFVLDGISKLEAMDFDTVCTSHGPVLQQNIKQAMTLYREWSTIPANEKTATIFYVSAYGYTEIMAEKVCEVLNKNGIKTESFDIIAHDYSELAEKIETSTALIFGSPTINRDAVKPVWDILSMVDAVSNRGKNTFIFGSYGWSGEACGLLAERAKGLSLKVFEKTPKAIFKPSDAEIAELEQAADEFSKLL